MLTFLRINSPFQLFALAVLLFLSKIPFISNPLPMLLPELEWMIVGEKMGQGNHIYREIWTSVPPLSGGVYWLVDAVFGRNQSLYELVAYLFIFFQAVYLSISVNRREFLMERNYVVGAVYILLSNLSFDMSKLSPALMGTTFLLFALNGFAKQINNRDGVRDDIFEVGLFVGIAVLFHLPMVVFLGWLVLGTLLFIGASFRQLLLIFLGFALPFLLVGMFFYFFSDFDAFAFCMTGGGYLQSFSLTKTLELFYTYLLPIVVALVGYFFLITNNRYNGGQGRMHQITLLGMLFGLIAYLVSPYKNPMQLYGAMPFAAILITGFLLHLRGAFLPEIAFLLLSVIILLIQYQGVLPLYGQGFQHLTELRVSDAPPAPYYKGKKMLITGERIDEYRHGYQVTAYLEWNLSKADLAAPNSYESVVNIFDNFRKSPPEVIIDKAGVFPNIFRRIPELGKDYRPEGTKDVYVLQTNKRP